MEKKIYIAPEVVVEVLETESSMLTASLGLNSEGGEEQSLVINRRGTWGDRWE